MEDGIEQKCSCWLPFTMAPAPIVIAPQAYILPFNISFAPMVAAPLHMMSPIINVVAVDDAPIEIAPWETILPVNNAPPSDAAPPESILPFMTTPFSELKAPSLTILPFNLTLTDIDTAPVQDNE